MHVILRTAVCLVVLASAVAAHLIAERVEEVLPLSAPAQIHVTSGPGDESEATTLVSDFAQNDLAASLVTFDATPDGVRRLLVLAPGFAERSAAPHALTRVDPVPAFGTRLASTDTRELETGVDTVYGQWTVFGSDPDVVAAAEALRAHGFTVEVKWARLVVVEQVVTVTPPLLVVAVALFLFATAAAAWVLTARSRRVRRVHGRCRGAVAGGDLLGTVAKNLDVALTARRTPRRTRRARRAAALRRVGLEGLDKSKVFRLSGGEQQRVALARLILHAPRVVLADEPTASLDDANAEIVLDLLREFADGGASVIVATHDPRVVAASDQVVELDGSTAVVQPRVGSRHEPESEPDIAEPEDAGHRRGLDGGLRPRPGDGLRR